MSNPQPARPRRRAGVLLLVGLLALTACSGGMPAGAPSSRDAGSTWKTGGSASAAAEGSAPPATLSDVPFDVALDAGVSSQWGDTLIAEPDWQLTQPDDGAGSWAYTHLSTGCVLWFWQGTVESDAADDRGISDELIAFHTGGTVAQVAAAAGELTVPVGIPGEGRMAMRAVTVLGSDERSVLVAGRGFVEPGTGLALRVTCPSPLDAETELTEVAPEAVVAVIAPF